MLIDKKGKINRPNLLTTVKCICDNIAKVRVPAGRFSVKWIYSDADQEKIVDNAIDDFVNRGNASMGITSSITDGISLNLCFPEVPYRADNISSAWEEMIQKSYVLPLLAPISANVANMQSVQIFNYQLRTEVTRILQQIEERKTHKIEFAPDIQIEFDSNGYNQNPIHLVIKLAIMTIQSE